MDVRDLHTPQKSGAGGNPSQEPPGAPRKPAPTKLASQVERAERSQPNRSRRGDSEVQSRRDQRRNTPPRHTSKKTDSRARRDKEYAESFVRREQEVSDLARQVAQEEAAIRNLKDRLRQAEENLKSKSQDGRKDQRRSGRESPPKRADSTARKGPQRKRRAASESPDSGERRRHGRDRYERSGSNERHDEREVAREAARKALNHVAASPLAKWIQRADPPARIKHNPFVLYETTDDPVTHIQHYQQAMFMHARDDALMCKMFPSSLGKVALSWYHHKLAPNSILSWKQLSEEFTARFLTSRAAPKTFDILTAMGQRDGESLREYSKRYWETFNEIEDCSEEYAIATFKTSLPVSSDLRKSLTMNPVRTVAKLMQRIEQHALVEDDCMRESKKENAG